MKTELNVNPYCGNSNVRFQQLIREVAGLIGLTEFKIDENNCCSIILGENDRSVTVNIELRENEFVLLFATLELAPLGITPEFLAHLDRINSGMKDGYYLEANPGATILCSVRLLNSLNGSDFVDWIEEFYNRNLEWRTRYRDALAAEVACTPSVINTKELRI